MVRNLITNEAMKNIRNAIMGPTKNSYDADTLELSHPIRGTNEIHGRKNIIHSEIDHSNGLIDENSIAIINQEIGFLIDKINTSVNNTQKPKNNSLAEEIAITNNNKEPSLSDFMKEAIQPHITRWMQENLEGLVKEIVNREIKKITVYNMKRAKDGCS